MLLLRSVSFCATFGLLSVKESWATKSLVERRLPFQPNKNYMRRHAEQEFPDNNIEFYDDNFEGYDDDDFAGQNFTCVAEPDFLFEGDEFYAEVFKAEYQPICSCPEPSGIDLAGFFAENPMPANPEELEGWADTFNNDFLGDFRYDFSFGCKNQCSVCLAQNGIDDCVVLDITRGSVVTSRFFEGFSIEEVTDIANATDASAEMVDRRAGTSMANQVYTACYTLTEGESTTVCWSSGEDYEDEFTLGASFCKVSVDGVDCLSCDDPSQCGESIVADCTNIAKAPAMIDTDAGNVPGIYAPLSLFGVYVADTPQTTLGSCTAGEGTVTVPAPAPEMEAPTQPVVDAAAPEEPVPVPAPAPEMEAPNEPAVDTTGPEDTSAPASSATSIFVTLSLIALVVSTSYMY